MRVVDLSDATDALLRGEQEEPVPMDYMPQYASNVPRDFDSASPSAPPRRNTHTMGGLSSVTEEDRAGTWGQFDDNNSQATWLSDEASPVPVNAMPREPGVGRVTSLPSPMESNPALLRI